MSKVSIVCFLFLAAAVSCQNTTPGSNPCSALPIVIPGGVGNATLYGSTTQQPITPFASSLCIPEGGRVSWYTITPPQGKSVVVSTCGDYTDFDTYIGIYNGNCNSPHCLAANDDGDCSIDGYYSSFFFTSFSSFFWYDDDYYGGDRFGSDPSSIEFIADGSQYFIAVSGLDDEYGNFDLTVIVGESKSGCPTAKAIQGPYYPSVFVNGTLDPAVTIGVSTCREFHFDIPGAWFKIFPEPNKQMNISTCSQSTTYDTRLAVLAGDCSSLECDYENDDDNCHIVYETSTVRFLPTKSSYYVLVSTFHYYIDETYNFGLTIAQESQAQDPSCVNAIPLHTGRSGNPQGSTMYGAPITTPICSKETGKAVWFRVKSDFTGSVTFSTCNSVTNFDTVLSVYGGECTGLTCMTQNDNGSNCSNGGSEVTLQLSAGQEVYLVLSGVNGAVGNYEIVMTSS